MDLRFYRGEPIRLFCSDDETDISTVEIKATVRIGSFFRELSVTDVDPDTGTYCLFAETGRSWPVGSLDCSISYTTEDGIAKSPIFQIPLVREAD